MIKVFDIVFFALNCLCAVTGRVGWIRAINLVVAVGLAFVIYQDFA